nr:retrotransposon protein, putative, Ty1-copia subclass [Tanacetum cinerariifolium]
MTKKPFSHKTEKVNDVLGLIHTNVCGPLIHVSKKCASYFITFTDDYSQMAVAIDQLCSSAPPPGGGCGGCVDGYPTIVVIVISIESSFFLSFDKLHKEKKE